jgi:PTH1 family peptidyl-tRNA hydrolase
MWLVVGLGNPGKKYTRNRHNIGFMVADELARRYDLPAWREKFGAELSSGRVGSDKALVLKPMEYMNNSGFAVARAAQFYQVEPKSIVVVHDEIDLPFARIRVKSGGGHGGHNGLRSIVAQLGSKDFARLRLGVGKPARTDGRPGDGQVSSHVLSDFAADQQAEVDALIRTAADAVEAIIESGVREAMNKFNGLGKEPKKKAADRTDGGAAGDGAKESSPPGEKSGKHTDPRGT